MDNYSYWHFLIYISFITGKLLEEFIGGNYIVYFSFNILSISNPFIIIVKELYIYVVILEFKINTGCTIKVLTFILS